MLLAMIERGEPDEGDVVTEADRVRWSSSAAALLAGAPCGCGECPSVELLDAHGEEIDGPGRIVLSASLDTAEPHGGALVILFIDGDRPSYLELAPIDGAVYARFPDPAAMD